MRINADDPDETLRSLNNELLEAMKRIDKRTAEALTADGVSVHADVEGLIKTASKILKLEWERVKEGEKNFQKAKRYCKGALVAIGVAAGILFVAWICTRPQPKQDVLTSDAAARSAPARADTNATPSSASSTLVTKPQTAPSVPAQVPAATSGAKP